MLQSSPAKTAPLVALSSVGVRRQGRWLVRGIDVSIAPGEIVTLIGPNGSGKSTTAKAAIGVIRPDEGRIERRAGLRVGYVPQKLSIDWTMPLTVDRLMTLTGPLKGREVDAALEATGIRHLARAEVQHLSGGEFQRALLARAIARKPDLLVLDEPVQGVDFSGEIALYDLIKTIRPHGFFWCPQNACHLTTLDRSPLLSTNERHLRPHIFWRATRVFLRRPLDSRRHFECREFGSSRALWMSRNKRL